MTRQLEQLMNWFTLILLVLSQLILTHNTEERLAQNHKHRVNGSFLRHEIWLRGLKVEAPLMEGRQFYGWEEQLLSAIIVKEQL